MPATVHLVTSHQTHCVLVDSSTVIYWTSPFAILGVSVFCRLYYIFDKKILFANNVDPDQTPLKSGLGVHCLVRTLL